MSSHLRKNPSYLVLPNKVYRLAISESDGYRAFSRDLIDFWVKGENPLDPEDSWRTLLGFTLELSLDEPRISRIVPLEWVLFRFLAHHVRSNSVHLLSGKGGEVLTTRSFEDYSGQSVPDDAAEQMVRTILTSWVRVFPDKSIELADVFISTDVTLEVLKRALNSLLFQGHIIEDNDAYRIKPSIMDLSFEPDRITPFDRKINRYFQEIKIQTTEPFCFVMMPFREEEFPQRIYTEVIEPFVRSVFKVSCYRVDEDHLPDRIDNKIYTGILRSSFIVAEVTSLNPNVFYEIGLAHMLERDCIILTQRHISEVPFDISRIRAEHYKTDDELRSILQKSISALGFKAVLP